MRFADLLEWAGGTCLIAACWLWAGPDLALLAAGLFLGYQAECHTQDRPGHALAAWAKQHRAARQRPQR